MREMAEQKITVVFVPGAWHSPDGYDAVISHLHKAGYKTSKVYTPSVLRQGGPPPTNFDPDVNEIRKHISEAIEVGQKVIVVMHSYGGLPGSQAIAGFDQATLAAQGHKDGRGIIHLVYLASFMLRENESLETVTGAKHPPWADVHEDGTSSPHNPAHTFYNDFESKDEIERWISDLRPWAAVVSTSLLKYEPWKKIPTTYLSCELDHAIPVALQKSLVGNAILAGAIDLRVINWNCGHTPFGVKPLEVSQIIRNTVGDRA